MITSTPHLASVRVMGVVTLVANLLSAAVVVHIFTILEATPAEFSAFHFSRPTLAVSLVLIAAASLVFGVAGLAASWRGSVLASAALLLAACIFLAAAWAMHQALWHIAHGMSHAGPYWFGRS